MSKFPGGLDSEYQEYTRKLSNQGQLKSVMAKTSYSDAIYVAARTQNREKAWDKINNGDRFAAELLSINPVDPNISHLANSILPRMKMHAAGVIEQHVSRSASEQVRYIKTAEAGEGMHSKYREYAEEAPDISRIAESAWKQALRDIANGNPFRAAARQGYLPAWLPGACPFYKEEDAQRSPENRCCKIWDIPCNFKKSFVNILIFAGIIGGTYFGARWIIASFKEA